MVAISIIIVNYRGWAHLDRCLSSIGTFTADYFPFEVIIVDNCSNDGHFEVFKQRFPQFRFYLNSGNFGFSNGCNLGASYAHGEYLLFLNSDIIATELLLHHLFSSIRANPGVFILSCKHVNQSGREEQMSRLFPSLFTLNGVSRSLYRKFRFDKQLATSDILFPEWVSGSVILISKYNFNLLGGWDERYWLYYEDVDLCRRAARIGGKVGVYTLDSVLHNHGGSTRINLNTTALTKTEVIISLHVYLSIHYGQLYSILLHSLVMFDSLFIKLIPALFGIPFFFVKRLALHRIIYFNLCTYYFNAMTHKTWISPRSLKYA